MIPLSEDVEALLYCEIDPSGSTALYKHRDPCIGPRISPASVIDIMGNEHGEVTESTSYPASRKSINLISDGGGRGVLERGRDNVLGRIRLRIQCASGWYWRPDQPINMSVDDKIQGAHTRTSDDVGCVR
jgi:hypothetical protein